MLGFFKKEHHLVEILVLLMLNSQSADKLQYSKFQPSVAMITVLMLRIKQ